MTRFSLLSFAFLCSPLLAFAKGGHGVTSVPVLLMEAGPRSLSMGGAFVGVADDLYTLGVNPAGLGSLSRVEVGGMYMKGLEDTSLQFVGFGFPLPVSLSYDMGAMRMGGGIYFSQNGTIEVNRRDPVTFDFLGSEEIKAGSDMVAVLGFGQKMFESEFATGGGRYYLIEHYFGASGKFIRSTLAQTYTAQACAADAGYLFRVPDIHAGFGASVSNVGSKLKYISEADPLPVIWRAGVSLAFPTLFFGTSVLFAAAADYRHYERDWRYRFGMEYRYRDVISFRAGYRTGEESNGLTLGFGTGTPLVRLEYGWAMNQVFSDTHRFSLSFSFETPWLVKPESRKTRVRFIEGLEVFPEIEKRRLPPSGPMEKKRRSRKDSGVPGWEY